MNEQARIYGLKDSEEDSIQVRGGFHPEDYDPNDSSPFVSHNSESEDDNTEDAMKKFKNWSKKRK